MFPTSLPVTGTAPVMSVHGKTLINSLPALLSLPSLVPLLPPLDRKSSCVSLTVYCQIPAYLGTMCVCVCVSLRFYINQHSTATLGFDSFTQLCLLGNTHQDERASTGPGRCVFVCVHRCMCMWSCEHGEPSRIHSSVEYSVIPRTERKVIKE